MARILKIKLTIGIISILVITLLQYVNSAGFVDVVRKRWGPLTWEDFDGYAPPFTSYGAGVASYVSFEYDSLRGRFNAYSFQLNVNSWVRRDSTGQQEMLRHEQYHFNISELFARRLNAYIEETPNCTAKMLEWQLKTLDVERQEMQSAYDGDTNHNLLADKQRRWEFKIDSLLLLEEGWVEDPYSGVRAYFASSADSSGGVSGTATYRKYSASRYGVYLSMLAIRNEALTPEYVDLMARDAAARFGATFTTDESGDVYAEAIYDSVICRTRMKFIGDIPYMYLIHARYPLYPDDTTGYAEIARSFVNSVRLPGDN